MARRMRELIGTRFQTSDNYTGGYDNCIPIATVVDQHRASSHRAAVNKRASIYVCEKFPPQKEKEKDEVAEKMLHSKSTQQKINVFF